MISIRKFWWTGVALATFVGCAEEPAPPSTPATPAAPTTPPPAETTPDPAKKDATEPAPTKEMEKTETPAPTPALPKIEGPKIDAPKPEADKKADSAQLSDEELANVKKLPAAEQALALKQLICPVSDEHLGAMDTPIKVTAGGKTFFICCKGCKKDVDADTDAVLAKLKN